MFKYVIYFLKKSINYFWIKTKLKFIGIYIQNTKLLNNNNISPNNNKRSFGNPWSHYNLIIYIEMYIRVYYMIYMLLVCYNSRLYSLIIFWQPNCVKMVRVYSFIEMSVIAFFTLQVIIDIY